MATEIVLSISAGATFLLASAAFFAIWQNRSIQIKNRKERLLNEIIDWSSNIQSPKFLTDINFINFTEISIIRSAYLSLTTSLVRIDYIKSISAGYEDLHDLVEKTNPKLKRCIKSCSSLLELITQQPYEKNDTEEKEMTDSTIDLSEHCRYIIEKASNLKMSLLS